MQYVPWWPQDLYGLPPRHPSALWPWPAVRSPHAALCSPPPGVVSCSSLAELCTQTDSRHTLSSLRHDGTVGPLSARFQNCREHTSNFISSQPFVWNPFSFLLSNNKEKFLNTCYTVQSKNVNKRKMYPKHFLKFWH